MRNTSNEASGTANSTVSRLAETGVDGAGAAGLSGGLLAIGAALFGWARRRKQR
ncbi:LPXTG cell wall anchor domain-containing protein [Micrococcales bacterium 31B]|nr:LPXTG cell wall anchor domain-containing protein [Micrococcales bacterium 31B]